MNKKDVRQKMLDIVGDIYHAKFAEHGMNGYTKFDGHTWDEEKYAINRAFDDLTIDLPKVKLPLEVGEELDTWIANNQDGYGGRISDLCGSLWDEIQELSATATFANKSEENYFKVIDAYRYGWEAEPEAKWYVKAPGSWHICEDCWANIEYGEINFAEKYWATPFTRAELNHYHLDSNIFTLVLVEEEK